MLDLTTTGINWRRSYSDGTVHYWAEAELDGHKVVFNSEENYRRPSKKTRLYVSGYAEATELMAEAERLSQEAGSLLRGVSEAADKAWDKANRQIVKNQKARIQELKEESELIDNLLAGRKFNFSRHAGCSCPCSPGFIADGVIRLRAMVPNWKGDLEDRLISLTSISL